MSEEVTSTAPAAEQTSGSTTTAAPLASTTQAPAPTPAPAPAAAPAPAPAPAQGQDDFSWVPKFFIKDGQPDFKAMATSYTELNKRWSSGARGSFAPSDIGQYEWQPPEGVDVTLDEESSKAFRSELQKYNVSADAYKFLMDNHVQELNKHATAAVDKVLGTFAQTEQVLRDEWGDQFDAGLARAQRALQTYLPDANPEDRVLNHPTVIKLLAAIGGELGEDTAPRETRAGTTPGLTKEKVQELMSKPDYWENPEAQKVVNAFFEKGGRL